MPSPLEGRRLWIAGIGGAGMSAYALLAREWGAEVRGWDRVRTPYLEHLAGIDVTIADDPPEPPPGWEVFVSTAFADRVAGRTRAELLAELVSLRDAVVVAGAHGKTTTAGMIAFCLERLGRDPAWLIGAEIPQLGGNAGTGNGWLVVEGDESDRTIAALRPRLAVVTNVDLDHHSTFASKAEVEALFDEWLAEVPDVVRGEKLPLYEGPLALPGEHNRRNAACALVALERIGLDHGDIAPVLAEFAGAGRRLERCGEVRGVEVYDDYAHHPAEIAATLAGARTDGRLLVVFQPHLYSRTRHLASELAAALAGADVVAVTDVYAAREEPLAGVSGKLVVDALAERRPGMPLAWTPAPVDGVRFLATHARSGDRALTIGAGDVDRAAPLLLELLA
ncbi:MAG TPA: cyanophycin synthetase [Gaiellaceae bacterium]|nr:cyanophycin synthetase [Gaiellaceae bacterium]